MTRFDRSLDAAPSPAAVESPPSLSVSYGEIDRAGEIGRGGSADVYEAHVRDTRVALKEPRIDGTLHEDDVEEFLSEAQTWSKLDDHDHVVRVLDWGGEPLPWIALEYMDGGTLAERMGELGTKQALWVAVCVARAVRHAHRHGVVHHDLKPENVLFASTGSWPVPKVSDWGLARQLLESSGTVEGLSPRYAAPEQFDPEEFGGPDDRTDVYQLGAVTFAALTGRPPYTGTGAAVMGSVLNGDPPRPSEHADVPPGTDDVITRALATDPADRFEATIDLRRALEGLLEDATGVSLGGGDATSGAVLEPTTDRTAESPRDPHRTEPELHPYEDLLVDGVTALVDPEHEMYGVMPRAAMGSIRRQFDLDEQQGRLPGSLSELDAMFENGKMMLSETLREGIEYVGLERPVVERRQLNPSLLLEVLEKYGYAEGEFDPGEVRVLVPRGNAPYFLEFPRSPPELIAYQEHGDVSRVDEVTAPLDSTPSVCGIAPRLPRRKTKPELSVGTIAGVPGETYFSGPHDVSGFVPPERAEATVDAHRDRDSIEPDPEGVPPSLDALQEAIEDGEVKQFLATSVVEEEAGLVRSKTKRTYHKLNPIALRNALSWCEFTPERYDPDEITLWKPTENDMTIFWLELPRTPREVIAYQRHGDLSAVDQVAESEMETSCLCGIAAYSHEETGG